MLTIEIMGNDNDTWKAVHVLKQVFEQVQVDETSDDTICLTCSDLPDNTAFLALLKVSEWRTAMNEIHNLYKQPIVSRDTLKRLKDSIESASQLACEFEELDNQVSEQVLDARKELERIEQGAAGLIISPEHPALKA